MLFRLKAGFVNSFTVLGLGPTLNCVEIGDLGFFFFFFLLDQKLSCPYLGLETLVKCIKGLPKKGGNCSWTKRCYDVSIL